MKYLIKNNKIKKINISGIIIKGIIDSVNKERRIFSGFGSVSVVDRQGDYLPIEEFKSVMEKLMQRGAPVTDSHSNHVVGKIVDYTYKPTPTGEMGLYLTAEIYNHYPTDAETWQKIQNGEYTGFSLGGKAGTKTPTCTNIGCYNILGNIEAWEFSIVERPANQLANIDKVNKLAKSDEIKKFVVKRGNKYCVISHDRSKTLGCHDTKDDAENQLRAIEANKSDVKKRDKFSMDDAKRIGDKLNIDWTKIDQHEFHIGLNIELEHQDVTEGDEILTGKIALAHLSEFPDYYNKEQGLPKMEDKLKDIKKERIYIKNPSEAPKGVKIEEGKRGGLYYESRNLPTPSDGQEGERGGLYYESEGKISSKNPKSEFPKIKQRRIKANMSNRYKLAAIGENKMIEKLGGSCCINANTEIKWNCPVDYIDYIKKIAYEVKTFSKESKDIKVKTNPEIKNRKEKWAKDNNLQLKTIVVIVDKRNNMTEGYLKDGYGGFRPSNMERIW